MVISKGLKFYTKTNNYVHDCTQLIPEVGRGGGEGGGASEMEQLTEAVGHLQHDLMKLEMHLVEQIDVWQPI